MRVNNTKTLELNKELLKMRISLNSKRVSEILDTFTFEELKEREYWLYRPETRELIELMKMVRKDTILLEKALKEQD